MPRDPPWCSLPEGSDREDPHPSRRCHRAPARAADPGGDGHRRLGAGRGRSRGDPHRLARPARLESPRDDERARIDHRARRGRRAGRSDAGPCGSGSHAIRTGNRCNGPSVATSAAPTQMRVRRRCVRSHRRMRGVQQEEDGGTADEASNQPSPAISTSRRLIASPSRCWRSPRVPTSVARRRASSAFRDNRAGRRVRRLPV